jgi:hypothetical protein
MNEKSGSFEFLEPSAAEALVPSSLFEPWMLGVLIVLALAVVVTAVILVRKKRLAVDPQAARRAAHAQATSDLAGLANSTPREAAVQCSLTLRKYLSVVANEPALFETHEEYVSRHAALTKFTEEARAAAGVELAKLATLKYTSATPAVRTPEVVASSQALLEILHHGGQA